MNEKIKEALAVTNQLIRTMIKWDESGELKLSERNRKLVEEWKERNGA